MTDAAIEGIARTADSTGAPVPAQITIINSSTGAQLLLRADVAGRFAAEHLAPGGPYRVEAHAPGISAAQGGIRLALGQRYRV
ncbi:MAG TPA: carboxypeptidase-like regulatory domain-containing protein, partial [Gemmatimonadaceae bacterium]|nr:carboxypeptidase-like regulatory domain-containing protein [Gemmatimonadaceae bacterium]